METISICSLNAHGLKDNLRRKTIIRYLKKQSFDIIALQETYLNNDEIRKFERELNLPYHYSSGVGRSKGIITAFSKKIDSKHTTLVHKTDRLLLSKIRMNDNFFYILNVYAPCTDAAKVTFFSNLKPIIEQYIPLEDRQNIICLGDFNTVRNNDLDIISGKPHSKRTIDAFNEFVSTFNLHDVWREQNPRLKDYTWSRPDLSTARRLDYILVGSNVYKSDHKLCTRIQTAVLTDHRAVILSIEKNTNKRGNNIFKIDNRLLRDKYYVGIIKNAINDTAREYDALNAQLKWEMIKVVIKQKTEQYTHTYKREQKLIEQRNDNKLKYLENQFLKHPNDPKISNDISKLKKEIDLKLIADTRAAATRAGVKWIQQGERSNAYFLGLEKSRANANTITALNDVSGNSINDPVNILEEIHNYYKTLYTEEKDDDYIIRHLEEFASDVSVPSLSENDTNALEKEITLQEVTSALKGMNAGSSPGLDGISTEFYKFFWIDIRKYVFEGLMYAKHNHELSISQRKGIFTLIHKGKDLAKDELKNWRPISLMNVDYKLLTRVLARRLQGVVTSIVHENQSGFIKGRQIANVIRELDDFIERDKFYKSSNLLLAIDFEKAFDTISCTFIKQMYKKFGIGEYFGDWIDIVMNKRIACVKNQGLVSPNFELQRGIRQGCNLSPLLFIMAVELLAIKVRSDPNIRGARYGKYVTKIRQYADDTTFLLSDAIDVREVLSRLKAFEKFSGLKINKSKSNILIAGNHNLIGEKLHGIEVCMEIKVLGVFFSMTETATDNHSNWKPKICKTKNAIKQWLKRDLTPVGKILIVKTFGISNFVYLMGSIGMPEWVMKELNTCFFDFIWRKNKDYERKTTERVKRHILCNDIEEGGLKMLDLRDFQDGFMLNWIEKLLVGAENEEWKIIPFENFEFIGGKSVFNADTAFQRIRGKEKMFSPFWVKAFERWQSLKNNTITDHITGNDPICNNDRITFKRNLIYIPECIEYKILRVRDVLKADSNDVMTFDEFALKYENLPNKVLVHNVIYNALERVHIENSSEGLEDAITFRDSEIGEIGRKTFTRLIKTNEKPYIVHMWKRKFDVELESEHWTIPIITTKEVRLRVLQWKILHNIYATNIHLSKMKIKETETCDWCDNIDHSDHAFFDCIKIKPLWSEVEKLFTSRTNALFKIKKEHVIFGILNNQTHLLKTHLQLLNHFILIGKLTISNFRNGQRSNIINMLHNEINLRISFE